jgi:protein-tyrosine phosphatase
MMSYKRLPLNCAHNVRDIGGYPVGDAGITNWGTFLRSEGLDHVTESDAAILYKYGIRTVIDLRRRSEFEKTNTKYLIDMLNSNKIHLEEDICLRLILTHKRRYFM